MKRPKAEMLVILGLIVAVPFHSGGGGGGSGAGGGGGGGGGGGLQQRLPKKKLHERSLEL